MTNLSTAQVEWAKHIYSSSNTNGEYGYTITDGTNNYIVGKFSGVLYLPNDTLYALGSEDIFIAKFDINGNNIWSINIGGSSTSTNDTEYANAVYDPVNNCIFLSGHFVNNCYFPGLGYITGNSDIFLARMDLNGNFIWAKKAGGIGNDKGKVYVNPFGKIYLLAQCTQSASFDGFNVSAGGILATYNSDGTCLSSEVKFNLNSGNGSNFVFLDFIQNDLVFYGEFISSSFEIDTSNFNSQGDYDAFIARADSTGKVKWIHKIQSHSLEMITSICIKENNDICLVGTFSDSLNFAGTYLNFSAYDIMIASIDQNGNLKWFKKFNINSASMIAGVELKNSNDELFLSGYFNGVANFGNLQMSSSTNNDMFLTKFDSSGNCLSYTNFGKAEGSSITIDNYGDIYVSGVFWESINIGNNSFSVIASDYDIYLAKFDATLGNNTRTAPNNTLIIYANPNKGTCNITIPDDLKSSPVLTLMIYNAQGSLIQKQQIQQMQDKVKLSLDAEAKGMYNVTLTDGTKMYYGKIVFE
jgi:hypothetical protein